MTTLASDGPGVALAEAVSGEKTKLALELKELTVELTLDFVPFEQPASPATTIAAPTTATTRLCFTTVRLLSSSFVNITGSSPASTPTGGAPNDGRDFPHF
jgi:hypothetical protein